MTTWVRRHERPLGRPVVGWHSADAGSPAVPGGGVPTFVVAGALRSGRWTRVPRRDDAGRPESVTNFPDPRCARPPL